MLPAPRFSLCFALLLIPVLAASADPRGADPPVALVPGPGESGHDPDLASLAHELDRQFFTFNAAPFSMSLDVHIPLEDVSARALVDGFLADVKSGFGPTAFLDFAGVPVFDVVEHYGEIGDLGMFGGVAAGGEALRYAVLRERCASLQEDCDLALDARTRVIEILEVLHVAHAITGENGVVVRGLFRRGMPRRGGDPATIPLADAEGGPNPPCDEKPENPFTAEFDQRLRFREDATQTVPGDPKSGEFPDWIWMDNASKDQLAGWVYAMGIAYDVAKDDPDIDPALVARLEADAARMARRLMRRAGPLDLDLSIVDGDGCATTFHDMNPEELEGVSVAQFTGVIGANVEDPELQASVLAFRNAFNGLLGLAAIRTFCHISGERDVCAFYYHDLVDTRGWHELLVQTPIPITELPPAAQALLVFAGFPPDLGTLGSLGIDTNYTTNYSNVNMAFVGFFGLLRYEPEPELRAIYADALERSLWDTGINPRQPAALDQSFFDFIYAGLRAKGTDLDAVQRGTDTLSSFDDPPYWNDAVENCDPDEIDAGVCTAIDGVTQIEIAPELGRSGTLVAVDPVPKAVRPPSNFEWRSNPYAVNGGGGDRLNPAGDFRGAYWLGRHLVRGDGAANLTPNPRDRTFAPEPAAPLLAACALATLAALRRARS